MKKLTTILPAFLLLLMAFQTDKPAYLLFDKAGKLATYEQLLSSSRQADIVLFGELHNNPICHWLQIELTKDLYQAKGDSLSLAAEMFEADAQLVLNEYLKGQIKDKHLTSEGKVWPNYDTDYAPLVDFAKEKGLSFIGSNIPRRYASLVAKQGIEGLDSLSEQAKSYIAPLPIEVDTNLPAYQNMLKMMEGMGHGGMNMVKAQAVKDATMAHFILEEWEKTAGRTVLHFNGSYHSNDFEGIYWYLKQANPELKIITINSVEQTSIQELSEDNKGKADFTICIPSTMTKTY